MRNIYKKKRTQNGNQMTSDYENAAVNYSSNESVKRKI